MHDVNSRVIGQIGDNQGPLLLLIGAIHGNEPGGVEGSKMVIERLSAKQNALKGEVFALVGNLAALKASKRYLSRDLNRAWSKERTTALENGEVVEGCPEFLEQMEIFKLVDPILQSGRSVFVLDLHSTSSESAPFSFRMSEEDRFAEHVPVVCVHGVESTLNGTFMHYLQSRGAQTFIVEGGEHFSKETPKRHAAAIWLVLERTGIISAADFPEVVAAREYLAAETKGLPSKVELFYRHAIKPDDEFAMLPGIKNFTAVKEGQVLAHDKNGDVKCPATGRIFMPLYQKLGEDGFFLVREL